jgi:hypothetical protein
VAAAQRLAAVNEAEAQRRALDDVAPEPEPADHVTWAELGCPADVGLYRAGGMRVRVKRIHIIVAEDDPAARFTVMTLRPPVGPPQFTLGHRVA